MTNTTIEAPFNDEYDPSRNTNEHYDDRNASLDEDSPPEESFVVDDDMSRNIGYSGRDPATESIV